MFRGKHVSDFGWWDFLLQGKIFYTLPLLLALSVFTIFLHSMSPHGAVQTATSNPPKTSSIGNGTANSTIHRSDFPSTFVFGTATSSYQVEGAANDGGRGPSIWDTFSHTPGKIVDGSNGDVAVDQYHRYKEDVDLMANMGMDAYRFSISWSRLFPDGSGELNQKGVSYYNGLIDYLISKGMHPYVTLYHWDLPQKLEDSIGGWLGSDIVNYWAEYAEASFREFGDRVKHWITFNEPAQFTVSGYGYGMHAPGKSSDRSISSAGDSAVDPYVAAHNVLRCHALAVAIYRQKYQAKQGGVIGITCDVEWAEPMTNSEQDQEAAQTHLEFQLGWYLDPIFFGDYPAVMRDHVGDRLPSFTPNEIEQLQGSVDFVGINHYSSRWVAAGSAPLDAKTSSHRQDQWIVVKAERDGVPIGDRAASDWLYIVPWGLQKALTWASNRYNRPPILITENGMDDANDPSLPLADALQDSKRVKFYQDYLSYVLAAIRDGVDVRAYFAWSLVDNFEWSAGYTSRFGLYLVDFNDGLKRHPKSSSHWFTKFLQRG